jgi:hypothetical protein
MLPLELTKIVAFSVLLACIPIQTKLNASTLVYLPLIPIPSKVVPFALPLPLEMAVDVWQTWTQATMFTIITTKLASKFARLILSLDFILVYYFPILSFY